MTETDKSWREHFTREEWKLLQTVPFWIVEMILDRRFDSWMIPQWNELEISIKLFLRRNPGGCLSLTKQVFTSLETPFIGDDQTNKQGLTKVRQILEKVPLKEAEDFKESALSISTAYALYRRTILRSNRPVIKGLASAADALGVSGDTLRRLRARLDI